MWISFGSFPEQDPHDPSKIYQTQIIVNQEGNTAAKYRKMHLFDAHISGENDKIVQESGSFYPGSEITDPCFSPVGYLGLSISYDLRFPELYRHLILRGAQILLVPSAFLSKTGSSHWETLLRTRAIENQAYVVAAAQRGDNAFTSDNYGFGHSMVVDPYGDIIAQNSDKEGVTICELDLDYLDKVRSNMNCLTRMRTDVLLNQNLTDDVNMFSKGTTNKRFSIDKIM